MGVTGFAMALSGDGLNAEIREISWSGASRKEINVSSIASTTGMDFLPSDLYDPGSLKVTMLHDGTVPSWSGPASLTVTIPGGGFTCSGFVSGYEVNSPYDGEVTATCTFKLTGALS